MTITTIKMSSKGQVVIPQRMRDELHAHEGTIFVALSSDGSIVLKKLETPSKEVLIQNLERIAKEGRKNAEALGIKESDVPELIHRLRKEKRQ